MIAFLKRKTKGILSHLGLFQKPAFLILGAQKAGTTALFEILNHHSMLHGSSPKETHFFDANPYVEAYSKYHTHFKLGTTKRSNFEATPRYLVHPNVPERLFSYNPDLKFIVILREPATRALSAWRMYHHEYKDGPFKALHDPRSFEKAISEDMKNAGDPLSYISYGLYADQIKRYFRFFESDRFLFLDSEELRNDFEQSLIRIQSFLSVPPERLPFIITNESVADDQYPETMELLKQYYKRPNEELFDLIGERYNW